MRHVAASVEVDRDERRERDEPLADEVVGRAVREEQPVRGLVHHDREAGVDRAHGEERRDPDARLSTRTVSTKMPIVIA